MSISIIQLFGVTEVSFNMGGGIERLGSIVMDTTLIVIITPIKIEWVYHDGIYLFN